MDVSFTLIHCPLSMFIILVNLPNRIIGIINSIRYILLLFLFNSPRNETSNHFIPFLIPSRSLILYHWNIIKLVSILIYIIIVVLIIAVRTSRYIIDDGTYFRMRGHPIVFIEPFYIFYKVYNIILYYCLIQKPVLLHYIL